MGFARLCGGWFSCLDYVGFWLAWIGGCDVVGWWLWPGFSEAVVLLLIVD